MRRRVVGFQANRFLELLAGIGDSSRDSQFLAERIMGFPEHWIEPKRLAQVPCCPPARKYFRVQAIPRPGQDASAGPPTTEVALQPGSPGAAAIAPPETR